MDPFTLIVTVGMVVGFLAILALGFWHPRSGADVLGWKPTRSAEVEVRNEIDDVAQMIEAQNRLRERRGKERRTQEQVEAQVTDQQRQLFDYADSYWTQRREQGIREQGVITVYEKTTCSNCRRLARILGERGIDFDRVDYHIDPLPAARIAELLAKAGIGPRAALRLKEPGAKALIERDASDAEILAAMEADPVLLQRPIVERGDRAVLARPAERVLELL
ncbi:MAG: ArsC/Spx/MgsR family protein [Solirubrobacteraceae bacterium]